MKQREPQLYIADLLESIELIEEYLSNNTREEFVNSKQLQDSVIRRFEIILIPWRRIISFRNYLTHEYFGVRIDRVWNVCEKDLPQLKEYVMQMKNDLL
jgi:uncharacterized protein with HEPN domain